MKHETKSDDVINADDSEPKKSGTRGQSLLETALVLPLLLLVALGIFEFGRIAFMFSEVTSSSREGARLVRSAEFVYPVFKNAKNRTLIVRLGLWLYELMALFRNIRRHQSVPVTEAI